MGIQFLPGVSGWALAATGMALALFCVVAYMVRR